MPRELITLQVGQCGNQIGRQFWQLALEEHARYSTRAVFDESMSSFFRNVDTRYSSPVDLPFANGEAPIKSLKARAILVDMEQGPVAETLAGPLGGLFDQQQLLTDVSGSGNNWAHGHCVYGPQYRTQLEDKVRHAVELCDSLQSFFVMHSMGGGTGSGLGTYILGLLEDQYPDVYRFATVVFPSEDDDVVTSPYNSILALRELTEHADCVLPIENEALMGLTARIDRGGKGRVDLRELEQFYKRGKGLQKQSKGKSGTAQKKTSAFEEMNNIVARLLTNLTSSMRFEGSLNVDLNEITTNLVPFPRLHFLLSSMSPLGATSDPRQQPRRLNQIFADAFHKDYQLIRANPRASVYLACGLLMRGNVEVSDINVNIQRLQSEVRMIHWNQEGFKVGVCSVPPVGQKSSLLCLSNNSCIRETFERLNTRFHKLYSRKAHMHHYTEFMDAGMLDEAQENARYLIGEYAKLERASYETQPTITRKIAVITGHFDVVKWSYERGMDWDTLHRMNKTTVGYVEKT
ncbi:Tubulin/FtsZ family protein [Phytophthora megakarya]|uniref:Tubulin/FtsZ family protein n=1 Tax=Phytophthora megakarya TaxID=4795 RepID=A0A225WH07_9STRA|nr:Tubulin/FtsZ family protein [Phytophthora megakarya]